jgi:hypothetical protein
MPDRPMPSFTKSPPELVERFGAVLDRHPEVQRKPMFGYPAAFVGGNMATGLFANSWIVRLPASELDDARSRGATDFEPLPGRPMTGFVAIPAGDLADEVKIAEWVARGIARAASMPAKQRKARRATRQPHGDRSGRA